VAALCINFDTTDFYNAHQALQPFLPSTDMIEHSETFAQSLDETFQALFTKSMDTIGKHPTTMTIDDKIQLVGLLQENGTFRLKGGVEKVAKMLGVTKFTVYNYLKKYKNNNGESDR